MNFSTLITLTVKCWQLSGLKGRFERISSSQIHRTDVASCNHLRMCSPPKKNPNLKLTIHFNSEAAINRGFSPKVIYFIQLQGLLNKDCIAFRDDNLLYMTKMTPRWQNLVMYCSRQYVLFDMTSSLQKKISCLCIKYKQEHCYGLKDITTEDSKSTSWWHMPHQESQTARTGQLEAFFKKVNTLTWKNRSKHRIKMIFAEVKSADIYPPSKLQQYKTGINHTASSITSAS